MRGNLTVMFTCHRCGLQRVRVEVRFRRRDEDVKPWMDEVARQCGMRHAFLSGGCPEKKCDLAIPSPANKEDGIGMSASLVPDMSDSDMLKSKGAN